MLLVLDVGNTNTVMGIVDAQTVRHRWRISTAPRTTDELGLLLLQLLEHRRVLLSDISGICVCCVVPSLLFTVEKVCRRYLKHEPLVVGVGIRTGMRIRMDNPKEVGADRIVNAVAGFERHGGPLVVVDFGTATTFDCISKEGVYLGGAIAPGFQISADALFTRTAMLPRVEVEQPETAIGTNTIQGIQSGLFWGYVGLVDGLARRCKKELHQKSQQPVRCVATGGLANLVGRSCVEVDEVDDTLTLHGLWLIYDRNRPRRPRS